MNEPTKKTQTEYNATWRARMKEAGLKLREVWVHHSHDDDLPDIRKRLRKPKRKRA